MQILLTWSDWMYILQDIGEEMIIHLIPDKKFI